MIVITIATTTLIHRIQVLFITNVSISTALFIVPERPINEATINAPRIPNNFPLNNTSAIGWRKTKREIHITIAKKNAQERAYSTPRTALRKGFIEIRNLWIGSAIAFLSII